MIFDISKEHIFYQSEHVFIKLVLIIVNPLCCVVMNSALFKQLLNFTKRPQTQF